MFDNRFEVDIPKSQSFFNKKNILITGGTGSFGNAFVDFFLEHYCPTKLVIFSRDEEKQYKMNIKYQNHPKKNCLRFFLGDVRDKERLCQAMRGIHFVIHAAALKQVPTAEYNPFEFIRTNVHGAENVAQAAIAESVQKVVALSTDKACCPINLYGASKLASDKIFVAANNLSGGRCIFSVVRYGNVAGSRGSVIPYFANLLNERSDVLPITDRRMTRFWITLNDGVKFVICSLLDMVGGEIFIPKIPSASVVDIAKIMAPKVKFEIIGIRPGEKLHEQMITQDDARNTCEQHNRYIIFPWSDPWNGEKYQNYRKQLVKEGFEYSSEKNSEWLSSNDINLLLKNL